MKLFVWDGPDVLPDYTSGMVVALAENLEEAWLTIRQKNQWAEGNMPALPTETIDLSQRNLLSRAWVVHGGG
mgnify:CR=1 FL=1